jgi:glycerate 2-kinase
MRKILIAPNSFKECADSVTVSNLIYNSLLQIQGNLQSNFELIKFPVSDGGDGFLNCVKYHFGSKTLSYKLKSFVTGDIQEFTVEYSREKKTLYIETAKIIGLNLVPAGKRNPLLYNSSPLGELLLKINDEKLKSGFEVEKVIIGIGGTATNDLGAGMLSMFGLELSDSSGNHLEPVPVSFNNAAGIIKPQVCLGFDVKIVVDVENPLLGDIGATKVFAGQKGALDKDLDNMEAGFKNILNLFGLSIEQIEGLSGAGGGLAAAFQLFFNTEKCTASEFIFNELGLENSAVGIGLAITGEGKLDNQTLLNKGAMIIYNYCRKAGIPTCFICGEKNMDKEYKLLDVFELKNYFTGIEESISRFPEGISKACLEIECKYLKNT